MTMYSVVTEDNKLELARSVGLSDKEYAHLESVIGRRPSPTELQMVAVMWSEHCSYKSSKHELKKLITKGPMVLQGPGENAGMIRLDDERALAFKVESHNHPSFVEPFQGAATGVGGILRDIFTMGARPVALGNYLRFGDLRLARHQYLVEGVISGIAHYGNCMGIPVVAGHVGSNSCYNGNILVNVFAAGIVDQKNIFKSNTARPDQIIMVWGARTGRDGIHGASLLASAHFEAGKAETTEQKIRVQVGDPFLEKVLMEATLEAMSTFPLELAAIQDMGAAGLTSSTTEMASKSNLGMLIDLENVPSRESGMQAWELLLSESQERMLAIVKSGSEHKFKAILEKWGCEAAVIGTTTDTKQLVMKFHGDIVVDLPIADLMDPPVPDLPEPHWVSPILETSSTFSTAEIPADLKGEWDILGRLLRMPVVASKEAIFMRYDTTVGNATVLGPGHEAAVLWTPSEKYPQLGIAFKGVAEEDLMAIDPRRGAAVGLAKAARGLACVGAKPQAYTDGMNLGNPYDAQTQAALKLSVEGFNDAAKVFGTPCISGNVSLHNQTVDGGQHHNIYPTQFVVMAGIVDDVRRVVPSHFQKPGSEVWLIEVPGCTQDLPFASLYARSFWKREIAYAQTMFLDLQGELRLHEFLRETQAHSLILSSRDIGAGGLAVSLAKACFGETTLGFEGDFSKTKVRRDLLLFGESQGRIILELSSKNRAQVMKCAEAHNLVAKKIGQVLAKTDFCLRPTLSGDSRRLREVWSAVFV